MLGKLKILILCSFVFYTKAYSSEFIFNDISNLSFGLSRESKPRIPENIFASINYNNEMRGTILVGYAPIYQKLSNYDGYSGIIICGELGINSARLDLGGAMWKRFYDIPMAELRICGSAYIKWNDCESGNVYYGINTGIGFSVIKCQIGIYRNADSDNLTILGIGVGL